MRLGISIHALLAESDTKARDEYKDTVTISIHALLAESDRQMRHCKKSRRSFLSTLSLRRATVYCHCLRTSYSNFYPRSPCGERPLFSSDNIHPNDISIHALLAESDYGPHICSGKLSLFLSTLSLRRATKHITGAKIHDPDFYPRSPCGERP